MRGAAIYKSTNSTYGAAEAVNGAIKGMIVGALFEHQGKTYKLVKANGAILVNQLVKYDGSEATYGAVGGAVIATAAAVDNVAGVAETAIASGDFGWITVAGVASCLVANSTLIHAPLASSGTAGTAQTAPFTAVTAQKQFGTLLTANASGGVAARPVLLQGLI
jgi:hypothetical protein